MQTATSLSLAVPFAALNFNVETFSVDAIGQHACLCRSLVVGLRLTQPASLLMSTSTSPWQQTTVQFGTCSR